MKKLITAFLLISFVFLTPKTINAAPSPPPYKNCGFKAVLTKQDGTVLPEPSGNNIIYNYIDLAGFQDPIAGNSKMNFSFDLNSISKDNWTLFPPGPGGQPDFFTRPLRINWKQSTGWLDQEFEENVPGNFTTTSVVPYQLIAGIPNYHFYVLGKHTVLLKYSDGQNYQVLCEGTFTVVDMNPIPDADIQITSLNGLYDSTSEWSIKVTKVSVPNSWYINNYYKTIGIWFDGKYWKDITGLFVDTGNLNSPNRFNDDIPLHFTLKPQLGGTQHDVTLKAYGWQNDRVIKIQPFNVLKPGDPTPTSLPTPTPTPTPPEICFRKDSVCDLTPNFCEDPCNKCPWCIPTPGPIGTIQLPNLEPLCDQFEKVKGFNKVECNRCVNGITFKDLAPTPVAGIYTAIGCIPADASLFLKLYVFTYGIGIAGGIAFLYFLYGAFLILTSAGNPEHIEEGKQIITSALSGLILIIFSMFLLRAIGVDILRLPGFS